MRDELMQMRQGLRRVPRQHRLLVFLVEHDLRHGDAADDDRAARRDASAGPR